MESTMRMTIIPSPFQKLRMPKQFCVRRYWGHVVTCRNTTSIRLHNNGQQHSLFASSQKRGDGNLIKPISAAGSEAYIEDQRAYFTKKKRRGKEVSVEPVTVENAKIVVESRDDNKMQLRVDITGEESRRVFAQVLRNLGPVAPSIPGFGRRKRGKSSTISLSYVLEAIGQDRVTSFTIQEIVSSTIAQYVNKENLNVKGNKTTTTQSAAELKLSFVPGNEFGFNAIVELENSEVIQNVDTQFQNKLNNSEFLPYTIHEHCSKPLPQEKCLDSASGCGLWVKAGGRSFIYERGVQFAVCWS